MQRDRYADLSALLDHESTSLDITPITTEDHRAYSVMSKLSSAIQCLETPNPTDPDFVIGSVLDKIDRNPLLKIF